MFTAFEITAELKLLERVELEAELTREYGLLQRAKRAGFLVLNYADLCQLRDREVFWRRDAHSTHRCRRVDVFVCSVCHAEDRSGNPLEQFLQMRYRLHRADVMQYHLCTAETVRMTRGCTLFSFAHNERVQLLSEPREFITATASWFICLETGRMHRCLGREQCSALTIQKEEGITLAYSCVISGYAKAAPVTAWNSWDGVHFYSAGRLAQIRNEIANRDAEEAGDEEADDAEFVDYDEAQDEEPVPRKQPQPVEETKKRKIGELLREENKPAEEQEVELEADAAEEEEIVTEEEDNDASEQNVKAFLVDRNKRDVDTPIQSLKHRAATALHPNPSLSELAVFLAHERIAEEQRALEQKAEYDAKRSRAAQRFGFASNNREMRTVLARVQPQLSALKDKTKTEEGDTVQRCKASKRTYLQLSAEEKTAQFLARGSEEIAIDVVWYLFGAEAKNRIAASRLQRGIEVANLAVSEMMQEYEIPYAVQVSVWCEKLSDAVGCTLYNTPASIDSARYCRIIMDHWTQVSTLPLVTEMLDVHKKKKRKPLDFVLYCLGVLQCMAEGGITVRVQLNGNIPPVLLNSGTRMRQIVLNGPKVGEFPDESAALGPWLLRSDLIECLTEAYPDGYQFTASSLQEARQIVRQCYEARHRLQQQRLYNAIEEWELQRARGEPSPLTIKTIYLNYCRWLQPPHLAKHD